ncbi:hypothetical protein ElyMa_001767900 [Elysia marginata]|uniref:CTNNB1 binding N-teminal domain-containing protein n=1 Tax=Elysia marginata TaxID=1093978 RepID=A0AAV4ECA8_9GAST|nr:hypothetical protein ElyMa_001767900 [Elysia marginata]
MFLLPQLADRKTSSSDCTESDDEESIPSIDSSVAGPSRPASLHDLYALENSQSLPLKDGHEQGTSQSRPSNCVSRKRKGNFRQGIESH